MYKLTDRGMQKVKRYLAELNAKRKEILDSGKDTADETNLPTVDDIISDIEWTGVDEDGSYLNGWGVTDNYDSDYALELKLGRDFIKASTSIECSTRDPYKADSKYKLSQRSRNYLSKYMDLTQDVIADIEQHAEEFDVKADISAYYKDIADFISDWVSIGYSTREAIKLFGNNEDEFLELPSGEIVRFVM